jgi:hypothetical protein
LAAEGASDVKKAAEAFDRGREAYRAESYVEAAEHFEAADDYAASAASLRLAIAARREAGQLDRALTLAALALATYPSDETVTAEAQALIDEHRAEFGRIDVSCDEPCALLLDGKLVHGPESENRTLYVSPGSYQLSGTWSEDRTDVETVTVVADDVVSAALQAPALEVEVPKPAASPQWGDGLGPSPPKEEPRHGWSPAVFWTGAGLTALSAGISIGLGVNATNNPGRQAVIDDCTAGDVSCPTFQRGLANQAAANAALGVTVGIGALTIVSAFLTDWGGKAKAKSGQGQDPANGWSVQTGRFRIRPTLALGAGATLGARGTF